MPDRLPSLIVLVGFWIPPAVAGWVAAGSLQRRPARARSTVAVATLAVFVLGYAAATDPTFAPPQAVAGLAVVAGVLVLPGSALACVLAYRRRGRMLGRCASA